MDTYASVEDIATELGRRSIDDPTDHARITSWLVRAETLIRAEFRRRGLNLEAQIARGDPDLEIVRQAEVNAVAAKARNPDGLRQVTRQQDDWSRTEIRDRELSSGKLRILDEDWELLLPRTRSKSFSIAPQAR